MENQKTIVLSVFPGLGKTYAVKYGGINALDSDSSSYHWSDENRTVVNPNWPENYISAIKSCIDDEIYDYIFVSSHEEIKKALNDAKIPFSVVYPHKDTKDVIIDRLRNRTTGLNDESFINKISDNWDKWIPELRDKDSDVNKYKYCEMGLYLKSDMYLSDIINKGGLYLYL